MDTFETTNNASDFYAIPKFIIHDYKGLSATAKVLYALIVDKLRQTDNEYVIYYRADMTRDLNIQNSTAKKALDDLVARNLIRIENTGVGKPQFIYVTPVKDVYDLIRRN